MMARVYPLEGGYGVSSGSSDQLLWYLANKVVEWPQNIDHPWFVPLRGSLGAFPKLQNGFPLEPPQGHGSNRSISIKSISEARAGPRHWSACWARPPPLRGVRWTRPTPTSHESTTCTSARLLFFALLLCFLVFGVWFLMCVRVWVCLVFGVPFWAFSVFHVWEKAVWILFYVECTPKWLA